MVIIILESWFPHGKSEAVGKKFIEVVKKLPPDRTISKEVLIAIDATVKGMHTIGAYEVKDGKEKEALLRLSEAALMYTDIEGYTYSLKTYLSAVEAMPIIGLKAPEE